ncbi:hypothetical protein ACEPAF_930 [Sanghuangporus sanghuang]
MESRFFNYRPVTRAAHYVDRHPLFSGGESMYPSKKIALWLREVLKLRRAGRLLKRLTFTLQTLNDISSHSPLTAQFRCSLATLSCCIVAMSSRSESSCSSRSISPDETRRYFRTQRFPARPPTPSVFQLPDDDDPLLRRDPHRHTEYFEGLVEADLSYLYNSLCIDTKYLRTAHPSDQDPPESIIDSDTDGGAVELPTPSEDAREEHAVITENEFPCSWNRTFGGDCDVTFENKQQHDRHVLSHIPDARGVLWTTYKCRFCLEKRAEVLQKAAESGRIDKRDVGLFARKDPCDRHLRTIHSAENVDNEVAYIIEDATPWWWPSALSYTSTYNKPAENLEPRPDGENRTWREYLDDILDERPFARDKPLEPIEGLKMDIGLTDGGETASRPAKRRRSSK